MEQKKFYETKWFCILMLLFFSPVGIILLWKYKFFSRNVSIVLSIASAIFFIWVIATSEETEPTDNDILIEENTVPTESVVPSPKIAATPTPKEEKPTPTPTVAPKRKEASGKSNANISDFDTFNTTSVRNDTSGNWRLCSIAESKFDAEKYALSYYNTYFENDDQVHYIVNFSKNTTTCISCLGTFLQVTTYEYVAKEEHDAKKLGSGMLLSRVYVYLDNGDIEKIE